MYKVCKRCNRTLDINRFKRSRDYKSGRDNTCIDCRRARRRELWLLRQGLICIVACVALGCVEAVPPACEDYRQSWCEDDVETTVVHADCETTTYVIDCVLGCDDEGVGCQ
jgi:hypothetical protein